MFGTGLYSCRPVDREKTNLSFAAGSCPNILGQWGRIEHEPPVCRWRGCTGCLHVVQADRLLSCWQYCGRLLPGFGQSGEICPLVFHLACCVASEWTFTGVLTGKGGYILSVPPAAPCICETEAGERIVVSGKGNAYALWFWKYWASPSALMFWAALTSRFSTAPQSGQTQVCRFQFAASPRTQPQAKQTRVVGV